MDEAVIATFDLSLLDSTPANDTYSTGRTLGLIHSPSDSEFPHALATPALFCYPCTFTLPGLAAAITLAASDVANTSDIHVFACPGAFRYGTSSSPHPANA